MNNKIVRTFFGTHIDLSKVISISDARFIDKMGFGGWFVEFEIHVQLLDRPIRYRRAFEDDEYSFEVKFEPILSEDGKTPLAVLNLQKQVDELIIQWKTI